MYIQDDMSCVTEFDCVTSFPRKKKRNTKTEMDKQPQRRTSDLANLDSEKKEAHRFNQQAKRSSEKQL